MYAVVVSQKSLRNSIVRATPDHSPGRPRPGIQQF